MHYASLLNYQPFLELPVLKCHSLSNMHQTIIGYSTCRELEYYSRDKSISITFNTIMDVRYNSLLSILYL